MNMQIIHDENKKKFYSIIENEECFVSYDKPDNKTLDLEHTIVHRKLSGRGIAAELVKTALQYAETNAYKVIPTCSYVSAYIKKHPEYKKLVAE